MPKTFSLLVVATLLALPSCAQNTVAVKASPQPAAKKTMAADGYKIEFYNGTAKENKRVLDDLYAGDLNDPDYHLSHALLSQFDLNDDGTPEVLSLVNRGFACGARPCTFMVLQSDAGGHDHILFTIETSGIVKISSTPTNGYKDILFQEGKKESTWKWNGTTYSFVKSK